MVTNSFRKKMATIVVGISKVFDALVGCKNWGLPGVFLEGGGFSRSCQQGSVFFYKRTFLENKLKREVNKQRR